MNKHDKHKPLSAEELFKLLDKEQGNDASLADMDDFEKEALEGFAAHTNSDKAKTLTNEVNLAISQHIDEQKNDTRKNKVIWFSAAASIVFIIILSVFFFNETKEEAQTTIALNEIPETKSAEQSAQQAAPKFEENTQLINETDKSISATDKSISFKREKEAAQQGPVFSAEAENSKGQVQAAVKINDLAKATDALEESKKTSDEKVVMKEEQKPESANDVDYVLADVAVSKNSSKNDDRILEDQENRKDQASKKYKAKNEEKKAQIEQSTTAAATMAVPSIAGKTLATNVAYYSGGEKAIQDFVISYVSAKKTGTNLVGKYRVSATVFTNGTLKVNSIIQITREFCGCTDEITEALNTMTKWNAVLEDGKKVASNLEFVISF